MIYFLRHAYCVGVALALAALISLLTGGVRLELLPLFALLAYMVRMLDDHHDYDTDTKQKPLTKKTLLLLLIVFGAVDGALNLLFFGLRGLICLLPLACAVLQNRFEVLKLFFLTLVSAIYTAMYTRLDSVWIIVFLCCTLLLAVGFYVYKTSRSAKK